MSLVRGSERGLDIFGMLYVEDLTPHPQSVCGEVNLTKGLRITRLGRIPQDSHVRKLGHNLFQ